MRYHLTFARPLPAPASRELPPVYPPPPRYADAADFAVKAPLVIDATIRDAVKIKGAEAANVRPGYVRYYLTVDVVALIRAIDSVKTFDIFYIMTRGGPALSTETLNLYGYISAFTNFDISYSLTIAMVLTIFTNVALLLLYNLAFKARARGAA